jgi:hypothetical protein
VYQDNQEFKYWRNVLKRTVPPVTALASCGLNLRGTSGLLYLPQTITEYDSFLAQEISMYRNPKKT